MENSTLKNRFKDKISEGNESSTTIHELNKKTNESENIYEKFIWIWNIVRNCFAILCFLAVIWIVELFLIEIENEFGRSMYIAMLKWILFGFKIVVLYGILIGWKWFLVYFVILFMKYMMPSIAHFMPSDESCVIIGFIIVPLIFFIFDIYNKWILKTKKF